MKLGPEHGQANTNTAVAAVFGCQGPLEQQIPSALNWKEDKQTAGAAFQSSILANRCTDAQVKTHIVKAGKFI